MVPLKLVSKQNLLFQSECGERTSVSLMHGLSGTPYLALPSGTSSSFVLTTDGSTDAIGAMLPQPDPQTGQVRPRLERMKKRICFAVCD